MDAALVVLLVSTLTTTGLLALWAATSPRHWFVRTTAFLAVIAPLLWIPAYEPFVALAIEGATVAAGVQLARRRRARGTSALERAGSSPTPAPALTNSVSAAAVPNPANSPASGGALRFRIATLLWATVLLGIAAAIAARFPLLNRQGWQSILAVGVGGGLAVLLGWYAATRPGWRKLPAMIWACLLAAAIGIVLMYVDWLAPALVGEGWPPDPNSLSILAYERSIGCWLVAAPAIAVTTTVLMWLVPIAEVAGGRPWRRVATAATAAVVASLIAAPAGFALWRMLTPEPIPRVVLPQPNAYDVFVDAGQALDNMLVKSGNFDQDLAPRAQVAKAAAEVAPAVARARRAFQHECLVPLDYESDSMWLARFEGARSLARGFSVTARLAEMDRDFDAALVALLDAVQLGVESRRGGLIVDGLVGFAITSDFGIRGVYDIADQLTTAQCHRAIKRLERLEASCEPFASLEQRDRIWMQHAYGWVGRLRQAIDDIAKQETIGKMFFPYGFETPFRGEAAIFRLLAARLTLRAYQVEQGGLPANWDQVEAAGLSPLGVDPWDATGGRLRYRRTATGFVLYSVGQNGVDEGGTAPAEYEDPAMAGLGDPATGDLSLEDAVN